MTYLLAHSCEHLLETLDVLAIVQSTLWCTDSLDAVYTVIVEYYCMEIHVYSTLAFLESRKKRKKGEVTYPTIAQTSKHIWRHLDPQP